MNPFPSRILAPITAHRVPRTPNAEAVVARLRDFDINASAFLMDAELLKSLEDGNFVDDFDRAFEDFYYQIPASIRREIFPAPPADKPMDVHSSRSGGMAANR